MVTKTLNQIPSQQPTRRIRIKQIRSQLNPKPLPQNPSKLHQRDRIKPHIQERIINILTLNRNHQHISNSTHQLKLNTPPQRPTRHHLTPTQTNPTIHNINDRVRVLGGCYGGLLLGERLAGFKLYLRILGGRGFGGRLGPESRQVEHPVRLAREGISRQGDTTRVAILILGAPIN